MKGLSRRDRIAAQLVLRNSRRLATAMRSSRLPAFKTPEEYHFAFQPSVKREQIASLHELGFVARKENVVFLGPPGVGKTHLAISLAVAAAQSGRRIYYGTLSDLVESLEEAQAAGRLKQRLKTLTHPSLLVVDEIGYLPVTRSGATLFFQLIARRYEYTSTVVTSNKGFEEWGRIRCDLQHQLPNRRRQRAVRRSASETVHDALVALRLVPPPEAPELAWRHVDPLRPAAAESTPSLTCLSTEMRSLSRTVFRDRIPNMVRKRTFLLWYDSRRAPAC